LLYPNHLSSERHGIDHAEKRWPIRWTVSRRRGAAGTAPWASIEEEKRVLDTVIKQDLLGLIERIPGGKDNRAVVTTANIMHVAFALALEVFADRL
jgi:hypothetical protein